MTPRIQAFIALSALCAATPVRAQQEEHDEHAAAPQASYGFGSVSFENSCGRALDAEFNRAVALLHSFEFRSAIEGFNRVLAAIPARYALERGAR